MGFVFVLESSMPSSFFWIKNRNKDLLLMLIFSMQLQFAYLREEDGELLEFHLNVEYE